jgi:hypothetical protein
MNGTKQRSAAFDDILRDPEYQSLPSAEKQKVLKMFREGTLTAPAADVERPPPQDLAPAPGPRQTPAPGVLEAPTNVKLDPQGRVVTSQFLPQAKREVEEEYPGITAAPTLAQGAGEVVARSTQGTPSEAFAPGVAEWGVASALPVAGGIAGAALGAPLGPPGVVAGGMAGAGTGAVLNKALGISAETPLSVAAQTLAPGVGQAVASTLKGGGRVIQALPPVWQWIRQKGFDKIGSTIERLMPGEPAVDAAWDAARAAAPGARMIGFPATRKALFEYAAGRPPGFRGITPPQRQIQLLYKQTENLLRPTIRLPNGQMAPNPVTFEQVMKQFDVVKDTYKDMHGTAKVSHLLGSMIDDLERAAPNHPAAAAFREAAKVYKIQLGMLRMNDAFEAGEVMMGGGARSNIAVGNRLVREMLKIKQDNLLPANMTAAMDDVIAAFRAKPHAPIGELSQMLGIALGYGAGPAAAATILWPRVLSESVRGFNLNPGTMTVFNALFQGARRLDLKQRRQDLHRGGNPETDYGLDPDERDLAEADVGAQKGTP